MDKEFESAVAQLNEAARKLTGEYVATLEHTRSGTMVYLVYGTAHYTFNATGYNFIYNMQRLYNNPVVKALME